MTLPADSALIERVFTSTRTPSENCARIKNLGFTASKHIKMYGEKFELISDPFVDGAHVAIRAICAGDPEVGTLRLPVAILAGLSDLIPRPGTVA